MAGKFMVLDEAAARLGVSAEELNAMRDRREISAYRDGKSWKFKVDEIERLVRERGGSGGGEEAAAADDDLELNLDEPLFEPDAGAAGGDDDFASALGLDDELGLIDDIPDQPSSAAADDDLSLSLDDDDLQLADDSAPAAEAKTPAAEELSLTLDEDDDLGLMEESATPAEAAASAGGEMELDLDLDDELGLADDEPASPAEPPKQEAAASADDDLGLLDFDSDESGAGSSSDGSSGDAVEESLVLDDDAGEPEFSFEDADSGISLLDDAASASSELSFDDEPAGADALSDDLDDDLILGDDSSSSSLSSGSDESDFQLTPFDELDDDLSDSGSQEIVVESSGELSGLSSEIGGDLEAWDSAEAEPTAAAPIAAAATPRAAGESGAAVEAQYTGLDMTLLGVGSVILLLCTVAMVQTVANLGAWETGAVGATLMDWPASKLFGG